MDANEFKSWQARFTAAFPDTAMWLAGNPRVKELGDVWREALADVSLKAANEVTQKLVNGDLPLIAAYDRERIPAIVRKHSFALLAERMASLPDAPQPLQEKFRCLPCRDTGHVEVWSVEAMRLVHRGGNVRSMQPSRRLESVRCSCVRGFPRGTLEREAQKGDKFIEKTPRYGECAALIARYGDVTSVAAIEQFETWIGNVIENKYEAMGHQEFAQYNESEQVKFDDRQIKSMLPNFRKAT